MKTLYTVKEVAETLKLNPETIKRMIYRKDLAAVKVCGSWRIEEDEIERLIERK